MKCVYCGRKTNIVKDHFIPKSKGGTDEKNNIVPCCHYCNSSKSNKVLLDALSLYGFIRDRKFERRFIQDLKDVIKILKLTQKYDQAEIRKEFYLTPLEEKKLGLKFSDRKAVKNYEQDGSVGDSTFVVR